MSKEIAVFDYSDFPDNIKGKLIRLAGQIKRASVEHVEKIFELGEIISEAHELMAGAGRDGAFNPWVEKECGFSRRTAYNYLRVFQTFGKKCATLHTLSPTALYTLSAPETPKAAVEEAKKVAAKGLPMDAEQAKEIIAKFRANHPAPKAKPTPPPAHKPEPRSEGADEPEPDYGKCPNCAGTKWDNDHTGVSCAKCHHPHGEPAGGADEDRISIQRSKTVKTAEALMRAFDDLHHLLPKRNEHKDTLGLCKQLLKAAKEWK